jgi:H+/Na+-translocating ferredoxin:NAD+ oxidoreductase subunit G
MKYYLRLGLVLLIITAVASGILAFINSFTDPIIKLNEQKQKEEARMEVQPEAVNFDSIGTINDEIAYAAKAEDGSLIGYTLMAVLYGYSSDVKTMVGLRSDLSINKIKIISQAETPGLGANCDKPEFQALFNNIKYDDLKVDKDGGSIVSITGATITTRTVTNSIKAALESLNTIIADQPAEEVTE